MHSIHAAVFGSQLAASESNKDRFSFFFFLFVVSLIMLCY